MSLLLPSCEEIPLESLPGSDTVYLRQNLICPLVSPLYLKKLLSILQTVCSCSSHFHRRNLPPNALRYLRTNDIRSRLVFMRTPRKTYFRLRANLYITLVAMTYYKSVDWECPQCTAMTTREIIATGKKDVWRAEFDIFRE